MSTHKHCLNPRVKGHTIVGQQLPTLLDVTSVCLHTLLHVVANCWKLLYKVWNQSTFSYVWNECNNSQQCWQLLANNTVSVCTGHYLMVKSFFKNKNGTNCSSTHLKWFQILAIRFWWEAHSLCDKNKTKQNKNRVINLIVKNRK